MNNVRDNKSKTRGTKVVIKMTKSPDIVMKTIETHGKLMIVEGPITAIDRETISVVEAQIVIGNQTKMAIIKGNISRKEGDIGPEAVVVTVETRTPHPMIRIRGGNVEDLKTVAVNGKRERVGQVVILPKGRETGSTNVERTKETDREVILRDDLRITVRSESKVEGIDREVGHMIG
jgi:hypothetical protein